MWFASPAYLKRRGAPKQPADLPGHDLLEGSPALSAAGWTLRQDGSDAVEQVAAHFHLVANDAVVIQAAALEGLGIASLPTFAVEDDIAAGRLKPVLPDWSARRLDIHAVFPSHKSLSPALRAFVDLAAQRLQERLSAGSDRLTDPSTKR